MYTCIYVCIHIYVYICAVTTIPIGPGSGSLCGTPAFMAPEALAAFNYYQYKKEK